MVSIIYNFIPFQKDLREQILESINRSEEDPRLHKLANPAERRLGASYHADNNVRPRR